MRVLTLLWHGFVRVLGWLYDVLVVESGRVAARWLNRQAHRFGPWLAAGLVVVILATTGQLSGVLGTLLAMVSQILPFAIAVWLMVWAMRRAWRATFPQRRRRRR